MSNVLKLILTFGMFAIPSFIFGRLLISSRMNRGSFSSLSSLLVGLQLFLLVIMYVQYKPIEIGVFMLIIAFPGTFPVFYLLYPKLKYRVETHAKKLQYKSTPNKKDEPN